MTQKSRAWVAVGYPESLAEDWLIQLQDTKLDGFISPLHDKDVQPDGSIKKAHYHILLLWDNTTTQNNAKSIFDRIGAVMDPNKVESVVGYARYLLHLDDPDKYQYSQSELIVLGGADYGEVVQKSQHRHRTLREIRRYIIETKTDSIIDLFDYVDENGLDDWANIISNTNTHIVRILLDENRRRNWEGKKKSQNLDSFEYYY